MAVVTELHLVVKRCLATAYWPDIVVCRLISLIIFSYFIS